MHALFPALIAGASNSHRSAADRSRRGLVRQSLRHRRRAGACCGTSLRSRVHAADQRAAATTLCPADSPRPPSSLPRPRPGATSPTRPRDGRLRTVDVDRRDSALAKFKPPNGKPYALNLWNGVIYTARRNVRRQPGCGPRLRSRPSASRFAPNGGGLWGRMGYRSALTAPSTRRPATAVQSRAKSTARRSSASRASDGRAHSRTTSRLRMRPG